MNVTSKRVSHQSKTCRKLFLASYLLIICHLVYTVKLDCFKDFDFRQIDIVLLLLIIIIIPFLLLLLHYPLYYSTIVLLNCNDYDFFQTSIFSPCKVQWRVENSLLICNTNLKNNFHMELTFDIIVLITRKLSFTIIIWCITRKK